MGRNHFRISCSEGENSPRVAPHCLLPQVKVTETSSCHSCYQPSLKTKPGWQLCTTPLLYELVSASYDRATDVLWTDGEPGLNAVCC